MPPARLSSDEIQQKLKELKDWTLEGNVITKNVVLRDFVHAMGFVQSVALLAEGMDHHPDIEIRWNKVRLTLSTHSAGGLTDHDFTLAKTIDAL